jgi:pimeloyl-ACP methyl ester carboxylesterase
MADRETLMLVPGLNCTEALFRPQIEALSEDYDIRVADHRQDETIPTIAVRILASAPERFAIAGLSMGGYISLEVLRQAPRRVTRLALLDTTARPDTEEGRKNRERLIALAQSGRFEEVHAALWQRLVHPSRYGDKALEGVVIEMMRDTGPEAFVRQQRAIMGRPDSRPMLPAIEIPTLVLVGDGDAITPPEMAREMAEAIEWASLVVVPDCGHLSSLERPEEVNQALSAWLTQERGKV